MDPDTYNSLLSDLGLEPDDAPEPEPEPEPEKAPSSVEPYYEDEHCIIYHGDCRDVLPLLDPVETCITDPPYGLAFMGKAWDHEVPDETYWNPVRDVILPGGMLLAFGGTRLWHWLAVGIEQAGWEIRDTLMWLYGTGFPKSHDISKAIDKAAGVDFEAKPASGVGFMGPDGPGGYNVTKNQLTRTGESTDAAKTWDGWGTALKPAWEPIILAMNPRDGTFANNALEHGVAGLNIEGSRVGTEEVDAGNEALGKNAYGKMTRDPSTKSTAQGRWPANLILDERAGEMLDGQSEESSRFFYCAKASKSERGEGNNHPTVKPLDLLEYLCTLTATPTGGTVLDPFMGSGSTLIAARNVGRKAIGIEMEEEYCEIAVKRITERFTPEEG